MCSFKHYKKELSFFVLLCFLFFLQNSAHPVNSVKRGPDKTYKDVKPLPKNTNIKKEENKASSKGQVIEKTGNKDKKKKVFLLILGIAAIAGVVIYLMIKKKKKYTLKVNLGEGVEGSPAAGTYSYKKGKRIDYHYTLKAGYTDLVVTLDNQITAASGTIKIDRHRTLYAATTAPGSIHAVSEPAQAGIWLDGIDTGKQTPSLLENIVPGAHNLRFVKEEYWEYEVSVQVESKTQAEVSAELVPAVEWVRIPAGEFKMGDNFPDPYGVNTDARPVHKVYLDEYYIAKYEVTFQQFDRFCEETGREKPWDSNDGWGRGTRPVIYVSWDDADAFCKWLSQKTGENIHLPTEAQWEKAARGTDQRRYPWGDALPNCARVNFNGCNEKTLPVGSYPAGVSPYGLHDMAGNVWEWCQDWYDSGYYSVSPYRNPQGPMDGNSKVMRGGSWRDPADYGIFLPDRNECERTGKIFDTGFRVCKD